jgi:LuxR family maltose regulon positive regulatory protein
LLIENRKWQHTDSSGGNPVTDSINPPPTAAHLARPLAVLRREAGRPLIAVTAPTGYGKTMLLRALADTLSGENTVLWLSIGPENNKNDRFLAQIADAIAGTTSDVHIFIDRYEAIHEDSFHRALEQLIEDAGEHVQFYIASRVKLPFYHRLRSRHPGPYMLTCEHLKMNPGEMTQAIRRETGRELAAGPARRLYALTDGWPLAVMHYAALLKENRAEPLHERAALEALPVEMYGILLDNVFLEQPPETLPFMLFTSVPDFFDTALARLVTEDPDCHETLERLLATNLLLTRGEGGRFRYVPLFAAWLRTRLYESDERAPATIHALVSRWAEERGMLVEAVWHALRTPDMERAAGLLLGDIEITLAQPCGRLLELLDQFPTQEVVRRPSLALLHAFLLINDHRISAAEKVIDLAEALMTDEFYSFGPTGENLRGYFATIRSRIALMRLDSERGIALMHEAAALLQGPGRLYTHFNAMEPAGSSLLRSNAGFWGAIDQALAIYGYAEPLWGGSNQGYGIIQTILGECYYLRGQLEEAERSLQRGLFIGLDLLDTGIVLPAALTLVQLRLATGETQAARAMLEEIRLQIAARASVDTDAVLEACQALVHIKTGQTAAVRKWLKEQRQDTGAVPDITWLYEYIVLLRAYICLGRTREGLAFGERLAYYAEARNLHYYVAEINLLLALLHADGGDNGTAVRKLEKSLETGSKEGYVQLYLEEWDKAEPLVDALTKKMRLHSTPGSGESVAFCRRLQQLRDERWLSTDKDRFVRARLTNKEYAILQLLIEGRSNNDIADKLAIRLETVKTHCKNIYGKLGLKGRKAVMRHFEDIRGATRSR